MNNNIQVEELIIGRNTLIEPSAIIRGIGGKAKKSGHWRQLLYRDKCSNNM